MILITDIINSPVGHALLQLLLSQKEHEPVRVMVTPYDRLSHEDGFEPVVSSFYDLPSLDRAVERRGYVIDIYFQFIYRLPLRVFELVT